MAGYIDEYFSIKGYYPLASGVYSLPAVIYLNTSITKVDYPIHYDNVTVYDYDVLVGELNSVLGDRYECENDLVENYSDPQKYIAKYYCAGNTYMLTANVSSSSDLSYHNRFELPEGHKYTNKSRITDFEFYPGFMHRYSIGSITNLNHYQFSLNDYNRLQKNNFKINKYDGKLTEAVIEKDFDKVKKLIKSGADINPLHEGFNQVTSPLIFAVRNNDIEMAKILIDAGADVNARGGYEDVVLIYALSQNEVDYKLVELLVDSGANVNLPNFFGVSPFVGACMSDDVALVKLFLHNNANLDQSFFYYDEDQCKKGFSPIKGAIKYGQVEVVKLLIDNGCTIDKGAPGDETSPIDYAKEIGNEEIVTLLSQKINM